MYELYADKEMRHPMENCEDFIRCQKRDQKMLQEQTDTIKSQTDIIAEKDSALAQKDSTIEQLRAEIAALKKSQ